LSQADSNSLVISPLLSKIFEWLTPQVSDKHIRDR